MNLHIALFSQYCLIALQSQKWVVRKIGKRRTHQGMRKECPGDGAKEVRKITPCIR